MRLVIVLCALLVGCATQPNLAVKDVEWCGQGELQESGTCSVSGPPNDPEYTAPTIPAPDEYGIDYDALRQEAIDQGFTLP